MNQQYVKALGPTVAIVVIGVLVGLGKLDPHWIATGLALLVPSPLAAKDGGS